MPQTWEWAVERYTGSLMPADAIARGVGMSITALYMRMNRGGHKKARRHRLLKAGTPDRYQPDAIEAARLKDMSARDAELLVSHPRFRCGQCNSLSLSNTCPNGHTCNPYLDASA